MQHIHASLVQGCSCFLKHAFGAPAKTPRALQRRVTGSCFVQAELSPAGLGLGSASAVVQRVWPVEGCWGSHGVLPSLHTQHGELAACLWNRTSWGFLLSWMSAVLGLWVCLLCWAEPWVTSEHPGSACLCCCCWSLLLKNQSASCCVL